MDRLWDRNVILLWHNTVSTRLKDELRRRRSDPS